jgi:hypothetical protein
MHKLLYFPASPIEISLKNYYITSTLHVNIPPPNFVVGDAQTSCQHPAAKFCGGRCPPSLIAMHKLLYFPASPNEISLKNYYITSTLHVNIPPPNFVVG